MGRAASLALAEHGADLLLADLNIEGAEKTAADARALGRRAVAAHCNVSQPEAIDELFAMLDREFGRIDFLGNIAGEGFLMPPEEISLEVSAAYRRLGEEPGGTRDAEGPEGPFVAVRSAS